MVDRKLILNRLKEHLNFKKNEDFANFLGIKANSLSTWYSRNTFNSELIMQKCEFLNKKWLLTGEGEMLLANEKNKKEENSKEGELQKEIDFQKAIIDLQKKLIEALEEDKLELEQRLKDKNNHKNQKT